LSFKFIENWYLWIIADVIYIPLYFVKELYFTSLLYVVFMSLCVMGLIHWRKVRDRQEREYAEGLAAELYGPAAGGRAL
jgi:nicotinamide mononucleotide transporter